jgi:hypothetical protein
MPLLLLLLNSAPRWAEVAAVLPHAQCDPF